MRRSAALRMGVVNGIFGNGVNDLGVLGVRVWVCDLEVMGRVDHRVIS